MVVKNLTAKRVEQVGGKAATQFDFSDDGNSFKMYVLSGVPLSVTRNGGFTYLSFRDDYIESFHKAGLTDLTFNVPHSIWSRNSAYKLGHKYNGVEEFDFENLIADLQQFRNAIIEAQKAFEAQTIEVGDLIEKLRSEAQAGRAFIENWRKNFDWFSFDDYKMNSYRRYAKSLLVECDDAEKLASEVENNTISKTELYNLVERRRNNGWVRVDLSEHDFYYRSLKESLKVA